MEREKDGERYGDRPEAPPGDERLQGDEQRQRGQQLEGGHVPVVVEGRYPQRVGAEPDGQQEGTRRWRPGGVRAASAPARERHDQRRHDHDEQDQHPRVANPDLEEPVRVAECEVERGAQNVEKAASFKAFVSEEVRLEPWRAEDLVREREQRVAEAERQLQAPVAGGRGEADRAAEDEPPAGPEHRSWRPSPGSECESDSKEGEVLSRRSEPQARRGSAQCGRGEQPGRRSRPPPVHVLVEARRPQQHEERSDHRQRHEVVAHRRPEQGARARAQASQRRGDERERTRGAGAERREHREREEVDEREVRALQGAEREAENARRELRHPRVEERIERGVDVGVPADGRQVAFEPAVEEGVAVVVVVREQVEVEVLPEPERNTPREQERQRDSARVGGAEPQSRDRWSAVAVWR